MSDKTPKTVRKLDRRDPRVARSTWQLGDALVQLMLEREFADITTEDILRRAGVSRSTFYAHYRNKTDVLYSSYEHMFAVMERGLAKRNAGSVQHVRIVPVAELSEHIGGAGNLVVALQQSGQMNDMWDLASGFIADMIERRIAPKPNTTPSIPPALIARMLAGAFLEMLRWWFDRQATTTPQQLDNTFHDIAKSTLASASYQMVAIA